VYIIIWVDANFDLPEKHMRWPAGSEEKRTHAIPRLYGRGFFLASFGNFGFDFLVISVYWMPIYLPTLLTTHLFTNKRLIHVSVLIFPLISLCIPVSLFKPAETRLFSVYFMPVFFKCTSQHIFELVIERAVHLDDQWWSGDQTAPVTSGFSEIVCNRCELKDKSSN